MTLGATASPHAIVVDLGYGDAGKGTVVDWLCATRPVRTVVRFNGGAQAAHNVVLRDGRHHTFAQFGAGTFHPGVRTHLSRHMVVDPLALAAEADHLAAVGVPDALDRLTVDGEALLATPYHRAANRARELARGADRHGSCGLGVGEAVAYGLAHAADAPRVADCRNPGQLRRRLALLRDRLSAELGPLEAPPVADCLRAYRAFAERVAIVDRDWLTGALRAGPCVFEGAQGVLLDEWHGFHPYTTWSTTTFDNAEALLAEAGAAGSATRIGVLRTVTTRHGPGPLVTEDRALPLTDPHNSTNPWQGHFRFGHFDAAAHAYALAAAGGVDGLALTHLDLTERGLDLRICRRYDGLDRLLPGPPGDLDRQTALTARLQQARPVYDPPPADWPTAVEQALDAPVVLTSHGPTADHKTPRGALLVKGRAPY
ncbi:adenylosuccinate synthase [Micromonospora phaseoli]|uniref:Adenylosuccinate synthetase n=1 Tax=Micromonospora phaseoli TaxID=1144548 RepID=A0A1H7BJ58_9ACTN|nr:adenylosuccinate synthetase [Micromonospora phaseoli]PZV94912.1 adenylosuccinate synthase [Micromonospora phaseoli]GIJ79757.1 adenylosuccinate synthetase [Micromonospora phaseoli]SEJ77763.1 adenylosuccinate synthase [Micromonospora phaseoli]